MRLLIESERLNNVIFKFLDKYIFKDPEIVVNEEEDWVSVDTPEYKGILGYRISNPDTLYYWGEYLIGNYPERFGMDYDEYKDLVSEYVKKRFGFKYIYFL
jgi:hypothetical protein